MLDTDDACTCICIGVQVYLIHCDISLHEINQNHRSIVSANSESLKVRKRLTLRGPVPKLTGLEMR